MNSYSLRLAKTTGAIAIAGILGITSQTRAALIAYEGFDYTAGQTFLGQNGGSGFTSIWQTNSTHANNALTAAGSFGYTDGNGNSLVTSGNRAHYTGNGTAVSQTTGVGDNTGGNTSSAQAFRSLPSFGTNGISQSTWISFTALRTGNTDISVDAPPNDYLYGRAAALQFFFNAGNTSAQGTEHFAVGRGTQSSETFGSAATLPNDTWGVLTGGSANATKASNVNWASSPADFILMRIDHVGSTVVDAANSDTLRVWINPLLNALPLDGAADITFKADDFASAGIAGYTARDFVFNKIRIFGGSENATVGYGAMDVDEIRIGEGFADVTPYVGVPEPAVGALAGLGILTMIGLRRRNK